MVPHQARRLRGDRGGRRRPRSRRALAGFPQHPRDDLAQLLRANFRPTDKLVLPQNCYVVNTGRHMVLFDTGVDYTRPFGPHTGKLLANLRAAGIMPEQIDAVACGHGHIDHVWGIIGGDGKEVVPGVIAVSAPGHTVGHTTFMVQSGDAKAMFIGDLAHHEIIMLRRPQIEFAFDTDSKQSAQSRMRVLRMLAQERAGVMAYHFAFPGIGHVAAEGEGFAWYPLPWGAVL